MPAALRACLLALAAVLAAAAPAVAQDKEGFYRNKQIRLVQSAGVGGGFEGYARAFAAHAPNHLAGKPSFIVESMPGAGGLRATNYLYTQAPRDGTVIGFIHSPLPFQPIYGNKAARYDARDFTWLGSIDTSNAMCISWHTSPVKTWDDVKQRDYVVGSVGSGSSMEVLPMLLNRLFQTSIRVVAGYHDGTSILLAMERGEVDGRCGGMLTVLRAIRPDWITEKKFSIPIVLAEQRLRDYPDSPSVMEMVQEPRTRQLLQLVFAQQKMDRPLLTPPGLPPQRIAELRAAFDATMVDPAFLKELSARNLTVDPVPGEQVAEIIRRAYETPPDVVEAARQMLGNAAGE